MRRRFFLPALCDLDELHAIEDNKRGDLLSLGLSRLQALAPHARRVGLSATVAEPDRLRRWLSTSGHAEDVQLVLGEAGAEPDVKVLETVRDALVRAYGGACGTGNL